LAEFTALGFFQLTGMPAADFTGLALHVSSANSALAVDLDNCTARGPDGAINEARSAACLQALQRFLMRLAQSPHEVPAYLEKAVALIESSDGVTKVSDVAAEVGVSSRHLNRLFSHYVGVPPKYFCRVLQVNRALQAMKENDTKYLTELAQLSGYFDQAHFNRAISEFFSDTPKEFLEKDETMLFEFLGKSRKY
jgi:AraC-like DNA-binding protein